MEVIMNGDIAKLVLNYLKSQKLEDAYTIFCKTSPYLKEEYEIIKLGYKPKHLNQANLIEIIKQHLEFTSIVSDFVDQYRHLLPDSVGNEQQVKKILEYIVDITKTHLEDIKSKPSKRKRLSIDVRAQPQNKKQKLSNSFIVLHDNRKSSTYSDVSDVDDDALSQEESEKENQLDLNITDDMGNAIFTPKDFSVFADTILTNAKFQDKLVQNINKEYETFSPLKIDQAATNSNNAVPELNVDMDQQLTDLVKNVLNTIETDSTYDQIVNEVCLSKTQDSLRSIPSCTSTPIIEESVPLKDRLRKRTGKTKPEDTSAQSQPMEIISNEVVNLLPVQTTANALSNLATHYIIIPNNQFNWTTQPNVLDTMNYPFVYANDDNIQIENVETQVIAKESSDKVVNVPKDADNVTLNKVAEKIPALQSFPVAEKVPKATPKSSKIHLQTKSLSTPSRKASHVRTLDFNTPLRLNMFQNMKNNPRKLSEKLILPESDVKKTEEQRLLNVSTTDDSRQEITKSNSETAIPTIVAAEEIVPHTPAEEIPASPATVTEAPINAKKSCDQLLLEWQKMRSMSSTSNFDQRLRELNSEKDKIVTKLAVPRTVKKKNKIIPAESPASCRAGKLLEDALKSAKKTSSPAKITQKKVKKTPRKSQIQIKLPSKTPRKEEEAVNVVAETAQEKPLEKEAPPSASKIIKPKLNLVKKNEKNAASIVVKSPKVPLKATDQSEKFQKSDQMLSISAKHKTPVAAAASIPAPLQISAVERIQLEKNYSLSGINLSTLLETPFKSDVLVCPQTPRFLIPNLDTPITRILNEITTNSSFKKLSDIPTPSCAITPGGLIVNSPRSTGGYSNRPTDYSSSSSYYRPDESEEYDQRFDAMIQSERKRLTSTDDGKERAASVTKEPSEATVSTCNEDTECTVVFNNPENMPEKNTAAPFDPDSSSSSASSSATSSSSSSSSSSNSSSFSELSTSMSSNSSADTSIMLNKIDSAKKPNRSSNPRSAVKPKRSPVKSSFNLRSKTPKKPAVHEKVLPTPTLKGKTPKKIQSLTPAALRRREQLAELEAKKKRTISILKNKVVAPFPAKKSKIFRKPAKRSEEVILTKKQLAMQRDQAKNSVATSSKRKSLTPRKLVSAPIPNSPPQNTSKPVIEESNDNARLAPSELTNHATSTSTETHVGYNVHAEESLTNTFQQSLIEQGFVKREAKILDKMLIRDLQNDPEHTLSDVVASDKTSADAVVESNELYSTLPSDSTIFKSPLKLKSPTKTRVSPKATMKVTENVVAAKPSLPTVEALETTSRDKISPNRVEEKIISAEAKKPLTIEKDEDSDEDEDDEEEEDFDLFTLDETDSVHYKFMTYNGTDEERESSRASNFNPVVLHAHIDGRVVDLTVNDEINIFEIRPRSQQRRSKSISLAETELAQQEVLARVNESQPMEKPSGFENKSKSNSSNKPVQTTMPAMVSIPAAVKPDSSKIKPALSLFQVAQERIFSKKTEQISIDVGSSKLSKDKISSKRSPPVKRTVKESKKNASSNKEKKVIAAKAENMQESSKSQKNVPDNRLKVKMGNSLPKMNIVHKKAKDEVNSVSSSKSSKRVESSGAKSHKSSASNVEKKTAAKAEPVKDVPKPRPEKLDYLNDYNIDEILTAVHGS